MEKTKKGTYRAECPTLAKIAAFTGIDVHSNSNFEVRTAAAKATPAVCATHTTTTMLPCNLQSIRAGYDAKRKVRTRVEAALPAAQPAGAPADHHKRRRQAVPPPAADGFAQAAALQPLSAMPTLSQEQGMRYAQIMRARQMALITARLLAIDPEAVAASPAQPGGVVMPVGAHAFVAATISSAASSASSVTSASVTQYPDAHMADTDPGSGSDSEALATMLGSHSTSPTSTSTDNDALGGGGVFTFAAAPGGAGGGAGAGVGVGSGAFAQAVKAQPAAIVQSASTREMFGLDMYFGEGAAEEVDVSLMDDLDDKDLDSFAFLLSGFDAATENDLGKPIRPPRSCVLSLSKPLLLTQPPREQVAACLLRTTPSPAPTPRAQLWTWVMAMAMLWTALPRGLPLPAWTALSTQRWLRCAAHPRMARPRSCTVPATR